MGHAVFICSACTTLMVTITEEERKARLLRLAGAPWCAVLLHWGVASPAQRRRHRGGRARAPLRKPGLAVPAAVLGSVGKRHFLLRRCPGGIALACRRAANVIKAEARKQTKFSRAPGFVVVPHTGVNVASSREAVPDSKPGNGRAGEHP